MCANYSWAWGPPWSAVAIPSVTPLEKTNFSLSHQASITKRFYVGVEFYVHFCSPCWNFVWLKSGQVLSMWSQSLCVRITPTLLHITPTLLCLESTLSWESSTTSGSYSSLLLLIDPWAWRGSVWWKQSYLGLRTPMSHYLHTVQFVSLC